MELIDIQNGASTDDFQLVAILEDDNLNLNYFWMKDGTEEFWMESGNRTTLLKPTDEEKIKVRKMVFGTRSN